MGIGERIREVLAIDPQAGAILYEDRWYTWSELAGIAGAVGAALDAAGLGAGTRVGLQLRNRPGMLGALLGVLASGRCAVTVSPHQGAAKLAAELRGLRLPALVGAVEDWGEAVREASGAVGSLGLAVGPGEPALTAVAGLEAPGSAADGAPLPGVALEMLTSGTTGAPKRVALALAALEHSLLGAKHYESRRQEPPRLREGVAILSAPLVHVGGLWRALQCIADGRRFALLDRFRVEPWLALVRRYRPKTVSLVPAALRMVLEADVDRADLASLAAVICGTAPLAPEEAEAFEAKYGAPVLTSYGATEFAGGVAGWNLEDHRRYRARKRGSVGRAHPGCELRVVAAEGGAVLAPGEDGLLEVRAAQLGPGSGWVRTTDLAALDSDGFLWIRGRADAAIVRGGFKVQPGAVQQVLEAHPAVREAAVVGRPDARLGAVPVAAVVLREGAPPVDADSLRAHAREHLASYEVPAEIRIVDALPRTPSLKVSEPDVRKLFARGG